MERNACVPRHYGRRLPDAIPEFVLKRRHHFERIKCMYVCMYEIQD